MQKRVMYWLWGIFFVTLLLRLLLAFFQPGFTSESYYHIRQVEHITSKGVPLYDDPLSYGGRENIFPPLFHYVMAFFNIFLPLEFASKLVPNVLIALITIIVFFISKKITLDDNASLMSAFLAGFLPVLYNTNAFTPDALFLPLIFLTIYAFLNIQQRRFSLLYIILFLALALTSANTFLLIIGFGIYLLLSVIESKKVDSAELELILFSLFFLVWTEFLFFKNVLLKEGMGFLWQNIPTGVYEHHFPPVSLAGALILVSIIPFLTGIYAVYRSLFQLKETMIFFLISLVISTTLLTWFRIVPSRLSLAFFGIMLAIFFSLFYHEFMGYLKKTKISRYSHYVTFCFVLILIPTMVYPAITQSLKQSLPLGLEIDAFEWINTHTSPKAGVLTTLEEGHLATYYAKRRNLMDDQFALISDTEQRFRDLNSIYTTPFQTEALSLLDKYNLNYIVLTPHGQQEYLLEGLKYFTKSCFPLVYNNSVQIYRIKCTLKKTE